MDQQPSYLDSLPHELFELIFNKFLEQPTVQGPRWDPPSLSTIDTEIIYKDTVQPPSPLVLSHVCNKWRQIAFSLPSLWSRIHMVNPSSKQLQLLDMFLERSNGALVDLHLREKAPQGQWSVPHPRIIVQMLNRALAHAERWGSILVDIARHTFSLESLTKFNDASFPSVRSISFPPICHADPTWSALFDRIAGTSLVLNQMEIQGGVLITHSLFRQSILQKLTTAFITLHVSYREVNAFLRTATNLRTCYIKKIQPKVSRFDAGPSLHLPNLHTLCIERTCCLPDFLLSNHFPSLAHLAPGFQSDSTSIHHGSICAPWPLFEQLQHQNPKMRLRHLTMLPHWRDPSGDMVNMLRLQLFSELEYLKIRWPGTDVSVLEALSLKEAGNVVIPEGEEQAGEHDSSQELVLLPRLKELVITGFGYGYSYHPLRGMIASRMAGLKGTPKCKVSIDQMRYTVRERGRGYEG